MLVRSAIASDADAWLTMRVDLWPGSKKSHADDIRQFFAGKLREPLQVLIAFDDGGKAIGFIELSIRAYAEGCETDNVAFIEGWYVSPAMRGKGVGADLVQSAELWARSQGCIELGSDTEVDNLASAAAHRAIGFEETGVVRCFRKTL
ncbi:MAG TPA: aminoglycoside 6'-N-acetyltransferase [Terriglobia bacterium]|nr:aminoglycoside 6'-N-acetyltransferase [Terriglobia bacterium]